MGEHGVGDTVGRLDAGAGEADGTGRDADPAAVHVGGLDVVEGQRTAEVRAPGQRHPGLAADVQLYLTCGVPATRTERLSTARTSIVSPRSQVSPPAGDELKNRLGY